MRLAHLLVPALALTLSAAACDSALTTDQGQTDDRSPIVSRAGELDKGAALDRRGLPPVTRDQRIQPPEPTVGTPPIDPAAWCHDTMTAAWSEIDAARVEGASCQADWDCTLAFAGTRCGGRAVHAVSHLGKAAFEAQVDVADETFCGELPDACPILVVDDFYPQAVCGSEGLCELTGGSWMCEEPAEDAPVSPFIEDVMTIEGCIDCGLAASKANGARQALVETVNSCEQDTDCVLANDFTGCEGGCGVAINVELQSDYDQALQNIQGAYCDGDCPIALPGCLPQRTACNDQGRCEVRMIEPPVMN